MPPEVISRVAPLLTTKRPASSRSRSRACRGADVVVPLRAARRTVLACRRSITSCRWPRANRTTCRRRDIQRLAGGDAPTSVACAAFERDGAKGLAGDVLAARPQRRVMRCQGVESGEHAAAVGRWCRWCTAGNRAAKLQRAAAFNIGRTGRAAVVDDLLATGREVGSGRRSAAEYGLVAAGGHVRAGSIAGNGLATASEVRAACRAAEKSLAAPVGDVRASGRSTTEDILLTAA